MRWSLLLAISVILVAAFAKPSAYTRLSGEKVSFGAGSASAYAELDSSGAPVALGIQLTPKGLESPPEGMTNMKLCVDRNKDGTVEKPEECEMTFDFVVPMPDEVANRTDIPFKWVLLNWNAVGHQPPGIYDTPHFDFHFMIASVDSTYSIEPGMCGSEFVDCDQFEIARKPVPSNYVPADFKDVEAVVPNMGNHLIDVTGSEFSGTPFTRSWIYGAYNGKVIFYEEMATLKHILSRPDTCNAIKTPAAVGLAGYYPTQSCIRYDESAKTYNVSLEGFEYRKAEAPTMAEE